MLRTLANCSSALVVALEYRLAPEHPYPAGLEDAYRAVLWLAASGDGIGGDRTRIAVAGDSAGGNLSAALCQLLRERAGPRLLAQLLLYPNVGNSRDTISWQTLGTKSFPTIESMQRVLRLYLPAGGPGVDDPLVSPLRGDLRGLPPGLVLVGGSDPLKDEGRAYADKLRTAGVEAGFSNFPLLRTALSSSSRIGRIIPR